MDNTIEQFNTIAYQLLEQISDIVDTPKVKMSKSVFKTVIEKEVQKPIEQFIIHLLPHKEHIFLKNEQFFLNYNISDNEQSYITDLIALKPLWERLSDENKTIIFNYLIQLCNASEYYFKLYTSHNQ
jgi:hypothetical protein